MLTLISAPASEPVALADARLHLRVTATGTPAAHPDDSLISALIVAARQHVEAVTGRALVTQTWEWRAPDFPASGRIELPHAPLASVAHVKYYDAADALQTFASTNYRVHAPAGDTALPGCVELVDGAAWPGTAYRSDAVVVRYVAGYGNAAAVPAALRAAMLLIVGHLYEHRENVVVGETATELPMAASALLAPFGIR